MKNRLKKKIGTLMCLGLVTLTAFSVAFTAAAYAIYERHTQKITVDLGYGKYFGANSGTKDTVTGLTKYYIENDIHLRNLSTLVNIGVFGPKDEFILNFTDDKLVYPADADPLTPIGNDQFPFQSQFHGMMNKLSPGPNEVPIIENLRILGQNCADVGMFGYISNEASISDFLLLRPTVQSTYLKHTGSLLKTNTFDYNFVDDNPLRNLVDDVNGSAKAFSVSNCSSVKIEKANVVYNPKIKDNNRIIGFTIDTSTFDPKYKLTSGTDKVLTAETYFSISNTEICTYANSKFTINTGYTDPNATTSARKDGEYFTVEYKIKALALVGDDYRYCEMVIERFKFYYEFSTNSVVYDETDFRNVEKLIYPDTYYIESSDATGSDETSESKYIAFDDVRSLYVGVIAGRIDGSASRIGVNYPILDIHRPFISNSMLFGKAIDDTNKRVISIENFSSERDFILHTNSNLTFRNIPTKMYNYYNKNNVLLDNADKGLGNRYVTDIYRGEQLQNYQTGTVTQSGFSKEAQNIIRIYGDHTGKTVDTPATGYEGELDNRTGQDISKDSVKMETIKIKKDANSPAVAVKSIALTDYMRVKMLKVHRNKYAADAFPYDKMSSLLSLENCIQFWATGKHDRSNVTMQTGENLSFSVEIDLDYVYFDSTSDENNNCSNQMEFRVANKSITARRQKYNRKLTGKKNPYLTRGFYTLPRFKNPNEFSIGNETELDVLGGAINAPKYQPVYSKDESAITPYDAGRRYRYGLLENINNIDGEKNLELTKSSGKKLDPSKEYIYSTKKIKISTNDGYKHMQEGATSIDIEDKISFGFFPCFYLGFKTDTTVNNHLFSFNIVGMRVTLSNKRGNASNTTGTVDFVSGTRLQPENLSGTKIQSKTIQNTMDINDVTNFNPNHFAKTYPAALNKDGTPMNYILHIGKSGTHKICILYKIGNIASAPTPTDKTYTLIPRNTGSLTEPIINYGSNITNQHETVFPWPNGI